MCCVVLGLRRSTPYILLHSHDPGQQGEGNHGEEWGEGGAEAGRAVAQVSVTLADVHDVILRALLVARIAFTYLVATLTVDTHDWLDLHCQGRKELLASGRGSGKVHRPSVTEVLPMACTRYYKAPT